MGSVTSKLSCCAEQKKAPRVSIWSESSVNTSEYINYLDFESDARSERTMPLSNIDMSVHTKSVMSGLDSDCPPDIFESEFNELDLSHRSFDPDTVDEKLRDLDREKLIKVIKRLKVALNTKKLYEEYYITETEAMRKYG